MERVLYFDLDGTLCDPAEGFVTSIAAACSALGRPLPERARITERIGPPLRETLRLLLELEGEEEVELAVTHYRDAYRSGGMRQTLLYPGIPEALDALRSAYALRVVTSKTEVFATAIVADLGLAHHFDGVHGAGAGPGFDDKRLLLRRVREWDPRPGLMIGDRREDIVAAIANGCGGVGVGWGYGSREELLGAGAETVCESPAELVGLLAERRSP